MLCRAEWKSSFCFSAATTAEAPEESKVFYPNQTESLCRTNRYMKQTSTKRLMLFFVAPQLVEKLTGIAEECQSAQLKKLRDVCEKYVRSALTHIQTNPDAILTARRLPSCSGQREEGPEEENGQEATREDQRSQVQGQERDGRVRAFVTSLRLSHDHHKMSV